MANRPFSGKLLVTIEINRVAIALKHASQEHQKELWESQTYYRAFSLVNGGPGIEDDLFAGLR